jgi:hypothetical protein
MSHLWDGTMVQDVPVYDAHAYTIALMVIPIGLMMGVFGFIWLAMSKKNSAFTVQSPMM